jgi:DNA-binding response OmpR family regulator
MRICIVDDDVQLSKALKICLQGKGYAVDIFNDGIEGQDYLLMNHTDYDLIILDWMMTEIVGLDICIKLRQSGIFTPILMLTAVNKMDSKVVALDAGADDYITKPFPVPELLARIRALLRRPKESKSPVIVVGDISLNTSTHKVTVAGKEIFITLKEFSILEYLMLHNNQVIGRDMILDHVWDIGFVGLIPF